MIYKIIAIHDSAVNAYMQPMFSPHTNAAVRAITDELHRPDSNLGKHPDDYTVYELGSYDDNTGELVSLAEPLLVVRCKDLITK